MTAERSAGHFQQNQSSADRALQGDGQAGIVLVSLQAQSHEVPIAIGSGESKALAKELIVAPVGVLVKVRLQVSRLGLHIVRAAPSSAVRRSARLPRSSTRLFREIS